MNTMLENLLSALKKLIPIKTKTTSYSIIVRGKCSLCGRDSVLKVKSFSEVRCPYCFPEPPKLYFDEFYFDSKKPQGLLKRKLI